MHVISLEVQNYLKVEAFHLDADGKHVVISARNGRGKTSIVSALFEALQSVKAKDRPEPVHRGADKAYIRLDLGDYIIEKKINTEGKATLVVTSADGMKIMSPQKILDGLLNAYSLDPVAFLHRRSQDQLDDVLKICGVEPPVEKVKKITGKSYPARPGESADKYMARLSADETGEVYQQRRDANRDVDTCRGAVQKQKDMLEGMRSSIPQVRPAPEIMEEITVLEQEQTTYQECMKTIVNLQSKEQQATSLMEELTRNHHQLGKEMESAAGEISKIELEILRLTDKKKTLELENHERDQERFRVQERINHGKVVIEEIKQQLSHEVDSAVPNPAAAIAKLREEWKRSNAQSEQVIKQQQAESRLADLEADFAANKNEHERLDLVLTELRQLRKSLLEGADFGVPGLSVGEGELLFDGIPFIQASQSQKLRVAAAVAMKTDAALKLLRIDNGELLDTESQQFLLDLASEQGWQVIMTRVSNDKELKVELVDGE